jgi:hypothetical protein
MSKKRTIYLEILAENLDFCCGLSDSILTIRRPDKLQSRTKRPIPPGKCSVYDVFTISTYNHKATIGIVFQALVEERTEKNRRKYKHHQKMS